MYHRSKKFRERIRRNSKAWRAAHPELIQHYSMLQSIRTGVYPYHDVPKNVTENIRSRKVRYNRLMRVFVMNYGRKKK
jgi:hypothetical protein